MGFIKLASPASPKGERARDVYVYIYIYIYLQSSRFRV